MKRIIFNSTLSENVFEESNKGSSFSSYKMCAHCKGFLKKNLSHLCECYKNKGERLHFLRYFQFIDSFLSILMKLQITKMSKLSPWGYK